MQHRPGVAQAAIVLTAAASVALAGCTTQPVSEAAVGLGRGGQRGEVVGVVVVCSGVVDGLDLAVADSAPPLIGDGLRRITRWVSPDTVTDIGGTDLVGSTLWPADTEIERFPPGADYILGAYADGRPVVTRPVVFRSEQFDTLSSGEIIVGDIRDGTSESMPVLEFLGRACDAQ